MPTFPDTMGPKNIAARMESWKLAHQPLTEAQALAQREFDATPGGAVSRKTRACVSLASGLFQEALELARRSV